MAEYGDQMRIQAKAAADLSALRYHIVRWSAEGNVNLSTAPLSSGHAGILQNKPESGEDATVGYIGPSKVMAGAALVAGAHFTTTTSGRATTVTSGTMALGQVLEASAADGEIVSCILYPPTRWSGPA